jgi:hypothetical protein
MPNYKLYEEGQAKEMNALFGSFTFENDQDPINRSMVIVAGREGTGKTHLACSMVQKGPVYLLDSEYRAQFVTRKFQGVKRSTVRNWKELVVAVRAVLAKEQPGTIIIDSGSDLQQFAEYDYLEMAKIEKVWPQVLWGEIYGKCDALINLIRFDKQPWNLVLTARVKEEYVADKPSGVWVPRLYDRLPYKADLVLQFMKNTPGKIEVLKDGINDRRGRELDRGLGLPGIIEYLTQNPSTLKTKE